MVKLLSSVPVLSGVFRSVIVALSVQPPGVNELCVYYLGCNVFEYIERRL